MSKIISKNMNEYYKTNMRKVMYTVTATQIKCGHEMCLSYGIDAFAVNDGVQADAPSISIKDISTDKEKIIELADKCNNNNLSLEHLYEVVDDFFDVRVEVD